MKLVAFEEVHGLPKRHESLRRGTGSASVTFPFVAGTDLACQRCSWSRECVRVLSTCSWSAKASLALPKKAPRRPRVPVSPERDGSAPLAQCVPLSSRSLLTPTSSSPPAPVVDDSPTQLPIPMGPATVLARCEVPADRSGTAARVRRQRRRHSKRSVWRDI